MEAANGGGKIKPEVVEWDEWTKSKEFLLSEVPLAARLFVWIIVSLVVVIGAFLIFSEFEDTAVAQGVIRPYSNVFILKSGIGGKITSLNISSGRKVKVGDPIMRVEDPTRELELKGLELQQINLSKKLEQIPIILALISGKSKKLPTETDYLNRWESYSLEQKTHDIQYQTALRAWNSENELPTQFTNEEKLRHLAEQKNLAKLRLDKNRIDFEQNLFAELEDAEYTSNSVAMRMVSLKLEMEQKDVLAPINGIIWETSRLNVGEMISAGTEIVRIVPPGDEEQKVELIVDSKDAGKMKPGMAIRYQIKAFPSTEYGTVTGKILDVSPDAQLTNSGTATFIVSASLDKKSVTSRTGKTFNLINGLQLQAWVILNKRSFLGYALEMLGVQL